mmetsp:Transcript_25771/g.53844  ORF Transcript_25771/g.53844 Transcript_25771/m.53844 type:complete len:84 (-) Transcript_25771:534-785(-)
MSLTCICQRQSHSHTTKMKNGTSECYMPIHFDSNALTRVLLQIDSLDNTYCDGMPARRLLPHTPPKNVHIVALENSVFMALKE